MPPNSTTLGCIFWFLIFAAFTNLIQIHLTKTIVLIGLREVIIKLLKNGADPNLRGKGGQTILHILIDKTLRKHINCEQKNRFVEAIRELLDTGSHFSMDVNAEDLQSKTPLHMAVSCGVGIKIILLTQFRFQFEINCCNRIAGIGFLVASEGCKPKCQRQRWKNAFTSNDQQFKILQ